MRAGRSGGRGTPEYQDAGTDGNAGGDDGKEDFETWDAREECEDGSGEDQECRQGNDGSWRKGQSS
jgi:hypothetical protein